MFLLRDLVSARTWLAMTQHLAGLFLGLAGIFIFAFGLGFGVGFVFLGLVGIPILGVTLRLADWFARAERARFAFLAGAAIPAWPVQNRAGYRWGIIPRWRTFTEKETWAEIGYGMLRLPFSAVALTLSVSIWAAALAAVTLPAYSYDLPSGGPTIGSDVYRSTGDLGRDRVRAAATAVQRGRPDAQRRDLGGGHGRGCPAGLLS